MSIAFDDARFNKALKSYFSDASFEFRSVCSLDKQGTVLGGCGFSPVESGDTYAYILRLYPRWATTEAYKEIMKYPFLVLGAKRVLAVVKSKDAINVGLRMGGVVTNDGRGMEFYKDTVLTKVDELLGGADEQI